MKVVNFWKPVKSNRRISSKPLINISKFPARSKSELKIIFKKPFGDKDKNKKSRINVFDNLKKKDMSWTQAKKRFPRLSPMGDADRDGVKNIYDCKPFDRFRQDKVRLFHGTTKKRVKKIMREGLKPKVAEYGAKKKYIYATNVRTQAKRWADIKAQEENDKPVILELDVDTEEIPQYKRDVQFSDDEGLPRSHALMHVKIPKEIEPTRIKEYEEPIREEDFEPEMEDEPSTQDYIDEEED